MFYIFLEQNHVFKNLSPFTFKNLSYDFTKTVIHNIRREIAMKKMISKSVAIAKTPALDFVLMAASTAMVFAALLLRIIG